MGIYPQSTVKRQNVINSIGVKPFGAFVKDGSIIPGWSATLASSKSYRDLTAMRYWPTISDYVLAADDCGHIYIGSSGTALTQCYADGGDSPFVFETHGAVPRGVIFSGRRYVSLNGISWDSNTIPYGLANGTLRRGRLFAVSASNPYLIRWSGTENFWHWGEGLPYAGNLTVEPTGGYIINLFDFEDSLVVFRESAIMRFSVYGDPENFKEKDTLLVQDICRKTIARAGDSILFFSSCGLMRYRDGKVTKIEGLISDDLKTPVSAFTYSNRYYFMCGVSRSLKKSIVYVYDILSDCYQIIDVRAYFISHDKESVLAYTPYEIYRLKLNSDDVPYGVISGNVDFGTNKRKLATLLEVDCDDGVTVKISDGKHERIIDSPNGTTRLNMRGNRFTVTFCGSTGSVRSAYLSAEVT